MPLQDPPRALELLTRLLGAALLPAAAAQNEPVVRGLALFAGSLEPDYPVDQHVHSGGGLPVHPKQPAHAALQP